MLPSAPWCGKEQMKIKVLEMSLSMQIGEQSIHNVLPLFQPHKAQLISILLMELYRFVGVSRQQLINFLWSSHTWEILNKALYDSSINFPSPCPVEGIIL